VLASKATWYGRLLKPVLELVYPTYCGGCGREGNLLCGECTRSFIALDGPAVCPVCGRWTESDAPCGECTIHRPPFERGFYGFSFEGALREAIHAFKFEGRKDVGRALVRMVHERIASVACAFDVVIPLPVTEKRLKERGFNQSFIIAEEISRLTGKPLDHGTLRKARETGDQYTLSKKERKGNIRGAFSLEGGGRLKDRRLLLVDDLYTTGATAREASKTLLRAKPRNVLLFALARTP
jgi:ComF family protein